MPEVFCVRGKCGSMCVCVFCEMFAALPSAQHDDDDDVDDGKSKRES